MVDRKLVSSHLLKMRTNGVRSAGRKTKLMKGGLSPLCWGEGGGDTAW